LHKKKLPFYCYRNYNVSILNDEDFLQDIQLHLTKVTKKGYIQAQDIVDYVATPEVQAKLGTKAHGIHVTTAQKWLHKLQWWYTQKRNGMYIDGHEHEDVVKYWEGFIARWKEYEKRFIIYGNDGEIWSKPAGFLVPQIGRFCLILVMHDKSTFYKTD
jgi:hypothetical protein